jgi:tripartite-type tricarboxylate transporter receptor subunit TctC
MPELPTIAESGLPGFDATLWYGVWAPAGTPAPVVERVSGDIARVLEMSDVRERLAKMNAETTAMTPAEFSRFVQSEAENVARIVKAAGIKPQ